MDSEASIDASVMISSASFNNGSFNYITYALSATLNALVPFQGQIITCGSQSIRSNSIPVNNIGVLSSFFYELHDVIRTHLWKLLDLMHNFIFIFHTNLFVTVCISMVGGT